jgi:hypothetical protein
MSHAIRMELYTPRCSIRARYASIRDVPSAVDDIVEPELKVLRLSVSILSTILIYDLVSRI